MSDVIKFNTETQAFGIQFKCSGYGLGELLKDLENPVGVEIGCSEGHTTIHLLNCNPTLHVTSIDPYVNYVDWNGNVLNDRNEFHDKTVKMLEGYSDRFTMMRNFSDDVVDKFDDESLDFIFIDGLHTYEQVLKDCQNYYSKVKPGCLFSGHDYTAIEGVHRAVVEFAASVGKEIKTTECDVWYWYK